MTIFISTHFMNEAERCDRISLMHAGRVLASDTPAALCAARGAATLEEAFIGYLEDATGQSTEALAPPPQAQPQSAQQARRPPVFSLRRLLGYAHREALELLRDPVRLIFALLGSVLLMFILGYGITMDVENLRFAVLDRDQSPESRAYVENFAASRYFIERAPIIDSQALDTRMVSGELAFALEIRPAMAGI